MDRNYNCKGGQKGADNNITSIKHAFVLSYYFLLRSIKHDDLNSYYGKVLTETIMLGGDCDANACIVSGFIGALVGVKRIPTDMLTTLIRFNDSKEGQDREGVYCIGIETLNNIDNLIDMRPEQQYEIKRAAAVQ